MPRAHGFTFEKHAGEVWIFAHGKHVTSLRGAAATRFALRVERLPDADRQQVMARVTGNHKRGNERPGG